MPQLLSSFGKKGVELNLDTMQVDIEDTSYLSKYFVIAELSPVFTGGKNPVAFNGSTLLKSGSEIKVECIDSNGNSLFIENPKSNISYSDVANFIISVNIFAETYNGPGILIFVGTTAKDEIVRWKANIAIDKTLQNVSKVRFYNKPTMEARGLLYPIVTNDAGTTLTSTIKFTGSFYATPVNPIKDVNRKSIDLKKTDIDYRLVLNAPAVQLAPHLFPTTSFNSQMEGQTIFINTNTVQVPYSYVTTATALTASFTVKKVLDSKTIQVNDAFYYTVGKNQFVTGINAGTFTSSYTWVAYNTASDSYQKFTDAVTSASIYVKQSYAEITYRNIRPFAGFVARHKLYRKSLIYPGDYQLIVDEPLGAKELLIDPITNNQTYPLIGTFYNQYHINKYWFTSSAQVQASHSVTPFINGVTVGASSFALMDGSKYMIAKADAIALVNDPYYYPYDSSSYNEMSGSSYASNFISLKAGTLYALSMNLVMAKDKQAIDTSVGFYFTSSILQITLEPNYTSPYGLQIGKIVTKDITKLKVFDGKQYLFFTPAADYFGTLIIVPYHCNVTVANISLQAYGDYGFSPDILSTKIPFAVNIQNEPFALKAELYDVNSSLVYSGISTIQTFDPNGESLFNPNVNSNPSLLTFVSGSLTVSKSLYLPNIPICPPIGTRMLAWHLPTHFPPNISSGDGLVCYSNITEVSNISDRFVNVTTTGGTISTTKTARSVEAKYTGSAVVDGTLTGPFGKRIWVDTSGTKTVFS